MHHRLAVAGAAALALVAAPASPQQPHRSDSSAPCDVPLAWRVGDVDPRFGVTPDEVRAAVRAAAALWEQGTGARLFRHDPRDGFPIRLVHDERQAEAVERRRAETEVRAAERRLETWRDAVERLSEEHGAEAAAYRAQSEALGERVAAYNRRVRIWNEQGGAPGDTVQAMEVQAGELDRAAADLARQHRRLEESLRRIQDEQRRLNDEIQAQNRRVNRLRVTFPGRSVQSGLYREEARIRRGRVVEVARAIEVFRFDDADDLVRIIAHELGHALGLGHVPAPGALMSEEYGRANAPGPPVLHPHDVGLFRSLCPQLAVPSGSAARPGQSRAS
jgi:primosomal protein N''